MKLRAEGPGPRVALLCPGLGHVRRGYEKFAAELGEALGPYVSLTIFKGGGTSHGGEVRVPTLRRDGLAARTLGHVSRNRYFFEEYSFALAVLPALVRGRFELVHYSEPGLNNFFHHVRRCLRWRVPTLFSHGVRMSPGECVRCHHLHQVTRACYREALAWGVPAERTTHLPYGLFVDRYAVPPAQRAQLRRELEVPSGDWLVLSVAALNRHHKRVDHLVEEVAALGSGWTLVLAGRREEHSLVRYARAVLGRRVRVVERSRAAMPGLYHAADVVCLASVAEGLPNALLEAMAARRPVLAHENLAEAVGHPASLVDMTRPGALAGRLEELRRRPDVRADMVRANAEAVAGCDWSALAKRYRELYERVAAETGPPLDVVVGRVETRRAEVVACRG